MKNKEFKQLQEGFANASKMIGEMIELKKLKIEELKLIQKPLSINWPMGAFEPKKEKVVWHPLAGNVSLEEIKRTGEALVKCFNHGLDKGSTEGSKTGTFSSQNTKLNLLAEIGCDFLEWADKYFKDKKNIYVEFRSAIVDHNLSHPYCITRTILKNKLKGYCILKGYGFNVCSTDEHGRVILFIEGRSREFIFIKDKTEEPTFPADKSTKHQEG